MTTGQCGPRCAACARSMKRSRGVLGELNLVPYPSHRHEHRESSCSRRSAVVTACPPSTPRAPPTARGVGPRIRTQPPPLNLTVNVSLNGFTVAASRRRAQDEATGTLRRCQGRGTSCPGRSWAEYMRKVKGHLPRRGQDHPPGQPDVPYELITKTMDNRAPGREWQGHVPGVTRPRGSVKTSRARKPARRSSRSSASWSSTRGGPVPQHHGDVDMMTILLVFCSRAGRSGGQHPVQRECEPPRSSTQLQLAEALRIQVTPSAHHRRRRRRRTSRRGFGRSLTTRSWA